MPGGEPLRLAHVAFLQKPEVLDGQREWVVAYLQDAFPGLRVTAAGSAEELPEGLRVDAVIAPTLPWLPAALKRLGRVGWIHFLSAGVERIWDMPFDRAGVLLTKSSGVAAAPMSEYALGAMLHFAKSFDRFVAQAREGRWERAWLDELTGRLLMILGMGHIGAMLAQRARVFGMRVVGVQRSPRPVEGAERCIGFDEVVDWLGETDYLVVCLPLTPETRNRVDAAFLAALKPGAVLVDISRGGVVVEQAVVDALASGRLRGAALDVFEREPLPADSALWGDPRVLLTPHVAGTTPYYMERALEVFVENARRLMRGEPPATPVDLGKGY
jgi:phosphoglycerate dehydrogenase-like enzyme